MQPVSRALDEMKKEEYKNLLEKELIKNSEDALSAMKATIAALPEKSKHLYFEIFTSQDRDGFFSIRANLDGPDLYVLNKAIDNVADIFDPKFINGELKPFIPTTANPFKIEYELNDVAVDCAAKWLSELWKQLDSNSVSVPVSIVGHDDYGTTTPITLK